MIQHDAVIVGAGIAGLRAAVELADSFDVAVLSKVLPTRSLSDAAQGGRRPCFEGSAIFLIPGMVRALKGCPCSIMMMESGGARPTENVPRYA